LPYSGRRWFSPLFGAARIYAIKEKNKCE
jgi:hypothetical protein